MILRGRKESLLSQMTSPCHAPGLGLPWSPPNRHLSHLAHGCSLLIQWTSPDPSPGLSVLTQASVTPTQVLWGPGSCSGTVCTDLVTTEQTAPLPGRLFSLNKHHSLTRLL